MIIATDGDHMDGYAGFSSHGADRARSFFYCYLALNRIKVEAGIFDDVNAFVVRFSRPTWAVVIIKFRHFTPYERVPIALLNACVSRFFLLYRDSGGTKAKLKFTT